VRARATARGTPGTGPLLWWSQRIHTIAKGIPMMRTLLVVATLCFLAAGVAVAQPVTTRYTKQHLAKTEEMLVHNLESGSADIQITTAQTIRDLENEFPEESFARLVNPLIVLVKNEKANITARILAALALENLHSDAGDIAIAEMMRYSEHPAMQELCKALYAKSLR
jgi:hypothetical protein